MSKYKIVYRDANPSWQELCPVRVLAVQVSRDTETGACFLQTKIVNVSTKPISRIEFTVGLEGEGGETETVDFSLLDADLPAGELLRPKAVSIRLSVITGSRALVTRADGETSFGDPIDIDSPASLALNGVEESERDVLLSEMGADASRCSGSHSEHEGWWQCGCGAVNLKRGVCWNCGAVREKLADLEDAAFLDESRRGRVYRSSVARLEKGGKKDAEAAKANLEKLAEQGYGDAGEKVNEAEKRIAGLANRRKKIALAAVAGIILLAVMVAISPLPSMLAMRSDMRACQEKIRDTPIGQTVDFGAYSAELPAYRGTSVAGRPIRWVVLDKQDGKALLVTEQCVDYLPFDEVGDAEDFESSTLHGYLNCSFMDFAFSDAERGLIDGDVTIPDSFLLYDLEPSDDFLHATSVKDGNEVKDWWTSTVEEYSGSSLYSDFYYEGQPMANYVSTWGEIKSGDDGSEEDDPAGVCPAIWVKLN